MKWQEFLWFQQESIKVSSEIFKETTNKKPTLLALVIPQL